MTHLVITMLNIILFLMFNVSLFAQNVQVETTFGKIEGKKDGSINVFLGIPFAKPPVGNLRWKPPQDSDKWDTILITKNFQSACIQKDFEQGKPDSIAKIIGSEDCLYLNVWTPDTSASLPVLFFIHGGGNQQGSASEMSFGTYTYNSKLFSERAKAVIVTIDYRVGPLGYLVHKGLESANGTSGNYGLLDQLQALKWVKKNIFKFGGNPDKVMIFGESAGGVNTGVLVSSPLSKGLFSRALMESGFPVAIDYSKRLDQGLEFTKKMGSTSNDPAEQINYLRSLNPDKLIEFMENSLKGGTVQMAWGPVIDGWVIQEDPKLMFEKGNFNKMPIVIGTNADEMALSAPQTVTPAIYRLFLKSIIPSKYELEVLYLYPPGSTNQSARDSYVQVLTDAQFTAIAGRTCRSIVKNQSESVYRYFFSHKLTGTSPNYGSFHGLELFYVFQTLEKSTYNLLGPIPQSDRDVMKYMLNYWRSFADSGNPNNTGSPVWNKFEINNETYLDINPTPTSGKDLRKEKCDFWDKVSGNLTSVEENNFPLDFKLYQNYPNPFNPSTIINYQLPIRLRRSDFVTLKVYDILGRKVSTLVNENKLAGIYQVNFDGSKLTSGIYFYRLTTPTFSQTKSMILLK